MNKSQQYGGNRLSQLKNKLRNSYRHVKRSYFKYIPIIGLIILFFIYFQQPSANNPSDKNTESIIEIIKNSVESFAQSFDFSDKIELFKTVVLMITIWTGYKYWLNNYRVIRRNNKLVDKVVFVILLLVFSNHINLNSKLGNYFDIGIFLLSLYLVVAGTWLFAKIIDSFNLESDLNCWGLRLFGIGLIIFGWILLAAGSMAKVMSNSPLAFDNIYWIMGLCIIALGAFSEFRSFRRHGVFVYMR